MTTSPPKSQLVEVPVELELVFPRGRVNHDFSGEPLSAVVRPLARTLLSLTNTGGPVKSHRSAKPYATSVRKLVRWLDEREFTGGIEQLTPELWRDFTRSPGCDHRTELCLRTLVSTLVDHDATRVQSGVVALARGTRVSEFRRGTPLDPFSEAEAHRLEVAAKQHISDVEARLTLGRELLAVGEDPRVTGVWNRDENLIALAADIGPVTREFIQAHIGTPRWLVARAEFGLMGLRELSGLLFPTEVDLVGYLVLLLIKTGLNPDSLTGMATDCSQPVGPGKVRLRWFKGRGGGEQADTFSSRGQWSPGQLIDRVRAATERSRLHAAPDQRDALWLVATETLGRTVQKVKKWEHARTRFLAEHDLRDDDGRPLVLDLRRLRKTYYARLDRRYLGAVNIIAGANQSPQVAADNYLAAVVSSETIQRTVENAQHDLVRTAAQARRRPLVLTKPQQEELLADPSAASSQLGLSPGETTRLLAGESDDVFAAKCKDFHHPPEGPAGSPCQAPVWTCLSCELAVVTPTKLPNVLRLLDWMDGQRSLLTAREWQVRFGSAHQAVREDILPRFSDEVIAAARAQASGLQFYVPPEQRAV